MQSQKFEFANEHLKGNEAFRNVTFVQFEKFFFIFIIIVRSEDLLSNFFVVLNFPIMYFPGECYNSLIVKGEQLLKTRM